MTTRVTRSQTRRLQQQPTLSLVDEEYSYSQSPARSNNSTRNIASAPTPVRNYSVYYPQYPESASAPVNARSISTMEMYELFQQDCRDCLIRVFNRSPLYRGDWAVTLVHVWERYLRNQSLPDNYLIGIDFGGREVRDEIQTLYYDYFRFPESIRQIPWNQFRELPPIERPARRTRRIDSETLIEEFDRQHAPFVNSSRSLSIGYQTGSSTARPSSGQGWNTFYNEPSQPSSSRMPLTTISYTPSNVPNSQPRPRASTPIPDLQPQRNLSSSLLRHEVLPTIPSTPPRQRTPLTVPENIPLPDSPLQQSFIIEHRRQVSFNDNTSDQENIPPASTSGIVEVNDTENTNNHLQNNRRISTTDSDVFTSTESTLQPDSSIQQSDRSVVPETVSDSNQNTPTLRLSNQRRSRSERWADRESPPHMSTPQLQSHNVSSQASMSTQPPASQVPQSQSTSVVWAYSNGGEPPNDPSDDDNDLGDGYRPPRRPYVPPIPNRNDGNSGGNRGGGGGPPNDPPGGYDGDDDYNDDDENDRYNYWRQHMAQPRINNRLYEVPKANRFRLHQQVNASTANEWEWDLKTHNRDKEINRESKLNLKQPTPFTGDKREKWRAFLSELEIHFQAKPYTYQNDISKVTFAASFLDGPALAYYTIKVRREPNSIYFTDWFTFVKEMGEMFGPFNPRARAQRKITNMKMSGNEQFSHFLTRFHEHLFDCEFNEEAQRSALKSAIADRLLSRLAYIREPAEYGELVQTLLQIDARFWEIQDELNDRHSLRERAKNIPTPTTNQFYNARHKPYKSSKKPKQKHTKARAIYDRDAILTSEDEDFSNSDNDDLSSLNHSDASDIESYALPPEIADVEWARKLTAKERDERMKQNLCLYCAAPNHKVSDCPTLKTRGRVLQAHPTIEGTTYSITSESGKD
jgi:hypothetical protein